MQDVAVVTTFARDHIDLYGNTFVDSFTKYCNHELYVFAEDFDSESLNADIEVLNYYEHIPQQLKFKKHILSQIDSLDIKPANRLRKALRWSYKSFVVWYALKNIEAKYIVWIDADVETIAPVPQNLIQNICNDYLMMCYPQRIQDEIHIESGFVVYNKQHPMINRVTDHYELGYHKGQILTIDKPWDGFWLGNLVHKDQAISNATNRIRSPFKNIKSYFEHNVGKDKFKKTDLNKYLGRKSLT